MISQRIELHDPLSDEWNYDHIYWDGQGWDCFRYHALQFWGRKMAEDVRSTLAGYGEYEVQEI